MRLNEYPIIRKIIHLKSLFQSTHNKILAIQNLDF